MVRRASTFVWAVLGVVELVAALLTTALPTASAQEIPALETSTDSSSSYIDEVLYQALVEAGLLEVWVDVSGISASASLVEVVDDEEYRLGRRDLLSELDRLAERRTSIRQRTDQADRLATDVEALEILVRTLRRDVSATGEPQRYR